MGEGGRAILTPAFKQHVLVRIETFGPNERNPPTFLAVTHFPSAHMDAFLGFIERVGPARRANINDDALTGVRITTTHQDASTGRKLAWAFDDIARAYQFAERVLTMLCRCFATFRETPTC